jgi:hypothetical protein
MADMFDRKRLPGRNDAKEDARNERRAPARERWPDYCRERKIPRFEARISPQEEKFMPHIPHFR